MQALRFTKSKIKFDNFLYTEEKDVANKMVLWNFGEYTFHIDWDFDVF